MSREWIAVEVISILVENFACLYFLNSRFQSKRNSYMPQLGAWVILVACGIVFSVSQFMVHGFITYGIMFAYLILFKHGKNLHKVFGVLIVCTIEAGTSIIGAGVASVIESTTIKNTLEYKDTSRLLAIVFIKMMQVVVFYVLAKKHAKFRNLQKRPAVVLSVAVLANFVFLFLIRMYAESPNLHTEQHYLLVWLAIGALFLVIVIFMLYELFIHEEIRIVEMALQLQRIELESGFIKEIDNIYSDIRTWQHDYKNNIHALRVLVDNGETEKALRFIDNIYSETYKNQIMLQTGNLVLDAIVSSKLWLAKSKNIEVTIQAIYPENNRISDNDLCVMAGNLLDNAIEACERMGDGDEKKFVDFQLMLRGKNLMLSVKNSCNDDIKHQDGQFITVKKEPFHGIGIPKIDSIVEKYQGHVLRSQEGGIFETYIMLPLVSPEE